MNEIDKSKKRIRWGVGLIVSIWACIAALALFGIIFNYSEMYGLGYILIFPIAVIYLIAFIMSVNGTVCLGYKLFISPQIRTRPNIIYAIIGSSISILTLLLLLGMKN